MSNVVLISFVCAGIIAVVYYNYQQPMVVDQTGRVVSEPPRMENMLYVFAVAFALVYVVMYSFANERSAHKLAMNEIEVGEPDF